MIIAPSLLAADFGRLTKETERVDRSGANLEGDVIQRFDAGEFHRHAIEGERRGGGGHASNS